jgi:transposase
MGIKGQKRRVYAAEVKLAALELCNQPNRTIGSVGNELGIPYKTLISWKKVQMEQGSQAFPGQGKVVLTADQQRIRELEREVAQLREEREILKKATAFFAKISK